MGNFLGCVQVKESNFAFKESFGASTKVLQPGCHCVPWCFCSRIAGNLNLRVQQLDLKCETKTKDNVFVTIVASFQYRAISDTPETAIDAFYKLTDIRGQIQSYVIDEIGAIIPNFLLDEVFDQKKDIAKSVDTELATPMSHYGYKIVKTQIVDIQPDENVKRAMNEINAAARLRLAATEKAEAERILITKRAEGEAEAKYRSGQGAALQLQAVCEGLRNTILWYKANVPEMSPKDVIDMVLAAQHFDTMKENGAHGNSTGEVIPHGPGAVGDLVNQIHNGGLDQGSSA